MANAFKRRTVNATTGGVLLLASDVGANTEIVVIGLLASNKSAGAETVTIELVFDTNNDNVDESFSWITNAPLPVGSSLSCMENKFFLVTGDNIRATANINSTIDVTISYLEITP